MSTQKLRTKTLHRYGVSGELLAACKASPVPQDYSIYIPKTHTLAILRLLKRYYKAKSQTLSYLTQHLQWGLSGLSAEGGRGAPEKGEAEEEEEPNKARRNPKQRGLK